MKRIPLTIAALIWSLLSIQSVNAEIKLPAIVSSNMVLQRGTTVELWGWADAKEQITIKASWLNTPLLIKADDKGSWRVHVQTTYSKAPQSIHLKSKTSDMLLDNILFGEVWLCSGQSNMFQPIKGYQGQPVLGSLMTTIQPTNENLRLFSVALAASKTPLQDVKKRQGWIQASPEAISEFSAVAYFFGQQLQAILDVPVGLIHSSRGGTRVEAWMSRETISKFQKIDLGKDATIKKPNGTPTVLFNAMINPLIPYTIKGVLWYQGESNRKAPNQYKQLFPAMVKDWRNRWGIGDFPFYFVQIAPFLYGHDNTVFSTSDNSAFIREAQLQCVDLIPNSGIAITTDVGERHYIHPPKKKTVADRLLFNALNHTYGYKTIDCASPVFDSAKAKNDTLVLSFKNAETGLYTYDKLQGFEVAGNDKVFYPATAIIKGDHNTSVYVTSNQVPKPVAVRYAWRNWVRGTLYDTNFLPASSFRTDNWDNATRIQSSK